MQPFVSVKDSFTNPLLIATVEDNKDPEFNYRVKVRIPRLHNDLITVEQLPWAARVDTTFMGIGDAQDLSHKVPEIGTQVLVLAVANDPNSLVYIGNLYKKTAQTPAGEDYLNTYGVYRKDGQFIGIDKIKKLFQMLFDGDINIDKVKDMTINVSNAVQITCQNATVNASSKVTLNTPETEMTGNLNVAGTINSQGKITSMAEVSANGGAVNLSTHVHQYEMGGTAAGQATTTTGSG